MTEKALDRIRILSTAHRRARDAEQDAREARDAAISEADDAGIGLRAIARATGDDAAKILPLSVSHVQRIVVAATATRQMQRHGQIESD